MSNHNGDTEASASFDNETTVEAYLELCRQVGLGTAYGKNCGWFPDHNGPVKTITKEVLDKAVKKAKSSGEDFQYELYRMGYIVN